MVKVALRFGCAKQSKNIEWFLQCMYQRKNHTIKQANEKLGNIDYKISINNIEFKICSDETQINSNIN